MAITYKSSGAGVSTETSGGALSPACPATVDAGDILILHTAWEGTTSSPSPPGDWTILGASPYNVGEASVVARHWVYGKIAAGTEDGATVALGAPAVTTQRAARIHSFAGRVAGSITDLVRGFSSLLGDTDPTGPTVATTVAGGLACALVYQNDNNTLETFASASDTWTERGTVGGFIFALNPGGVLDLLTATPAADPGTVSGGAMTVTNDPWSVVGFEVRPSLPTITGSGSPDAQSASVDGAGVTGSTGSGSPDAQAAAVDGAGVTGSTGTGALSAQAASVSGEGEVADSVVTGTGALAAQAASADGSGISLSTGSGALSSQAAAIEAEGVSGSTGSGALSVQAASADGSGLSLSTGAGDLEAQVSDASGLGTVSDEEPITGSGDLVAASAAVSGSGNVIALPSAPSIGGGFSVRTLGVPIRRQSKEPENVIPLPVVRGFGNLAAGAARAQGAGSVSGMSHAETLLLLLAA